MSDKKITLKVTVKPNGYNGWRTVCNAYPQIVGEGRDCEAALSSLVEKIREEFKEGTFKLDSQLIPAVSCQITEMKANLVLGTENYTLADFGTEAEADAEAEGEKDSADTPKVPEITSAGGCDTCKKYAEGDCGGTAAGDACKEYKPFRYLWERCENCQFSPDEHTHCTVYDAATYPDHYACTSFRPTVIQNEEAEPEEAAPDQEAEEERNCKTCFGLIPEEEAAGAVHETTPCVSCMKYLEDCSGCYSDKCSCGAYPACVRCKNCISLKYEGEEILTHEGHRYHWRVNCKEFGNNVPTSSDASIDCGGYEEDKTKGSVLFVSSKAEEADAAQTAEEAA